MSYTIADIKNDLTRKLHGTSLNKLGDVNGTIDEGIRQVLQDVDFAETKRTQQIVNAIYSDVNSYSLPSDLKSNKIIDIYPQANRGVNDSSRQSYSQDFEKNKNEDTFVVRYENGVKSLRYEKTVRAGSTIANLNSVGDWSTGEDAENLEVDKLNYISTSSLRFDLNGDTTQGYLENVDLESKDLSENENDGSFFLWVYVPGNANITSVDLRWGNSDSAYWNDTVTTNQEGVAFTTGWNLLRFDWEGLTATGTPDSSLIDYTRITINYDGEVSSNLRVDNLVYRLGNIFKVDYYSKYLLKDSDGLWIERVGDDSDVINLDVDSYNVLLNKVAEVAAQELQGEDSSYDMSIFRSDYMTCVVQYRRANKSEMQKTRTVYYKV